MATTKLKKILKMAENAIAAATFAEEGDFLTATTLMNESRRVLLALKQGQADPKTLKYAMNTARRINARLDILTVSPAHTEATDDPGLGPFLKELQDAGMSYKLVSRSGCLKEQVIDYTNSEKEILFAVIESPAHLDEDCSRNDRELSELWRTLKCPLVVVMDGAGA